MDPLHVVKEVVATRKAMTRHRSFAIPEVAQVRPGTVPMHSMSLTLMAKKASCRRKLHANAGLLVAAERLQMRVHILVVVTLQRSWLVTTSGLALLWTMVFAVFVGELLIQWVAAGNLSTLLF